MGAGVGVEQTIHLEYELTERAQSRKIAEQAAEPPPIAAVEMLGTGDQQVSLLPDEVGLLFAIQAFFVAGAFLSFGQASASAWASAGLSVLTAQAAQRVEDVLVDVFDDVKNAKLVAGSGPDFGQHFGVEVRAIGDDSLG